MQKQSNNIQVEPIHTNHNFFSEGDLVFAKCKNSPPWPARIRQFKGFDEEDVQVFTVDFMNTRDYAFMESYLLTPLSQKKISKMKLKYQHYTRLYDSLIMAQNVLASMKKIAQTNIKLLEKFQKFYQPDNKRQPQMIVDADQTANINNMAKNIVQKSAKQSQNYKISPFLDTQDYKAWTKDYKRQRFLFQRHPGFSIQVSTLLKQPKQIITKIISQGLIWTKHRKFTSTNNKTKLIYQQFPQQNKFLTQNFQSSKKIKKSQKTIVNVFNYISVQISMNHY